MIYKKMRRDGDHARRHKKSRQSSKKVISSAKEKKQKECASDLNDPEHQNEIF